ncbi:MAG: extracellular solute-binding protein [Alphaproteobacteria bacterium]|nr:extracellular solute-binding protein [Alphaproteobacteria bacterium]
MKWAYGGLAAAILIVGGAWFLMKAPAGSAPATLFQWQDYVDPHFTAAYEAAWHEKPGTSIFADEDEAFSKMRAGFKPDVMGPCLYSLPRWKEAGLIQPIETARLKNWNKIAPALRNLPGISAGPGKVWFVPHYWGNTSLTIRTDLAPEYAKSQSWDILFDPKYKGRVSALDGADDVVPFVAHMIGIDAYHMSDADWLKVQAKLRELVPQLRFVSADNTALAQGLASGEIVAAMSWRTTFASLNREHKPVAYLTPPGGIFTYVCGLVMHKDPSNEEKALALIDSGLADDAARYMITTIGDEPANIDAVKSVPDSVFQALNVPRDLESFLKGGIFQQPLPNKEKIVSAWTEIRSGMK